MSDTLFAAMQESPIKVDEHEQYYALNTLVDDLSLGISHATLGRLGVLCDVFLRNLGKDPEQVRREAAQKMEDELARGTVEVPGVRIFVNNGPTPWTAARSAKLEKEFVQVVDPSSRIPSDHIESGEPE